MYFNLQNQKMHHQQQLTSCIALENLGTQSRNSQIVFESSLMRFKPRRVRTVLSTRSLCRRPDFMMESAKGPIQIQFDTPLRLNNQEDGLAYFIFNAEGTESILLLHGGMTGAPEWDLVIPHFSTQYHLIVPDLPLHNNSKNMKLENASLETGMLLRDLIKEAAKGGQAHVVGMSMGAQIGRRLAVQFPDVVKTCFLSGFKRYDTLPLQNYIPYIVAAIETVGSKIPKSWMDEIEHNNSTTTPRDFAHFKKVWNLIMDDGAVKDQPFAARTLVVAASKGPFTNDSTADAKWLALLAQRENSRSMAVQHKRMRHAWVRQDPKLVAEAVICWIESKPLPDGFQPL
ncbi:alpha/beta-hydrolase [Microthyrium microscopicum]|uniref:Alpha/beta-hydrolase n=1 Tax=Microthyrium microscopicum TaxID=703497 RepID=A0A6A6U9X8_9PEZI|nr:alpha/beta-hydrolase [Microthyrium microscopicum]